MNHKVKREKEKKEEQERGRDLVYIFLSLSLIILAVSELLQLSIDMCKLRVNMMPQDCRKAFFNLLTSLIEKSTDVKLLKSIAKIVDDWVKNRVS